MKIETRKNPPPLRLFKIGNFNCGLFKVGNRFKVVCYTNGKFLESGVYSYPETAAVKMSEMLKANPTQLQTRPSTQHIVSNLCPQYNRLYRVSRFSVNDGKSLCPYCGGWHRINRR